MLSTFSIGQVSKQLEVSSHTLRFWERELRGIIVPLRTKGGQRRYTREHVKILREIKRLRKEGFSLAEIRARLSDQNPKYDCKKLEMVDRVANEIAEIVRLALSSLLERNG